MTGRVEQFIQVSLERELDGEHEVRRSFAGWLIRNTSLDDTRIAETTGLSALEVSAMAAFFKRYGYLALKRTTRGYVFQQIFERGFLRGYEAGLGKVSLRDACLRALRES